MSNCNMAEFIAKQRKSNNLTQKQLAEKLNVTDKAVSKWERGLGYPDITTLTPLAGALGVTVNELLTGAKAEQDEFKSETIVENTLEYADNITQTKKVSYLKYIKFAISITFLLAIIICFICDLAVFKTFTWSVYAVSSILFAWLIIIPLFQFKRYRILISLTSLSIFILPFIFIILFQSGQLKWFTPIVSPVCASSLLYLWLVYSIFALTKINRWICSSLVLVISAFFDASIDYFINKALGEPLFNEYTIMSFLTTIALAAIVAMIPMITRKKTS